MQRNDTLSKNFLATHINKSRLCGRLFITYKDVILEGLKVLISSLPKASLYSY